MASRRLRSDLPFQRIAVVLTGGGSWGAYEVGALRVLERLQIKPTIVAGVSVGALNAVTWIAHGFQTAVLERVWRRLSSSSVGLRWTTIGLRALGSVIVAVAALEFVLLLGGTSSSLVITRFRTLAEAGGYTLTWIRLEGLAWILLALIGWMIVLTSRNVDAMMARMSSPARPERMQRIALVLLGIGIVSYAAAALLHYPWPLRFHLLLLLGAVLAWLVSRPGPLRDLGRWVWQRLIPETRGRGLWRGTSLRRLLDQMVSEGRPGRLVDRSVRLVMSACDMHSGRMAYFVNPPDPGPEFQAAVEKSLGEVVILDRVADIVDAAVASSAVPVLYEPQPFRGREYLDGGLFSNQPLHAVTVLDADAIVLVLVSPSVGPSPPSESATLIDIASRLNELSNWRDLQAELRDLPARFSREARPANVCVIEPNEPLSGSMFDFDARRTAERIAVGEHDAWKALEAAGWLESEPGAAAPRAAAAPVDPAGASGGVAGGAGAANAGDTGSA